MPLRVPRPHGGPWYLRPGEGFPLNDSTVLVPSLAEIERATAGATPAEMVLLAEQYLRVGLPYAACTVCDVARARGGGDDPAMVLMEATARFAIGERDRAAMLVEDLLARRPTLLAALHLKAQMEIAAGRTTEARELLRSVVEAFPDFPGAQGSLSTLLFPGPHYRDVLARIHRMLRPDTYLEIGVETGATLRLATTARVAVGVDPVDALVQRPLPPNARLYTLESDAFFARESRESVFGGRPVDLAFIDGMHWFEWALRDFVNVERWSAPSSTILLHDCLPITRVSARRERASVFWVGDTWKVLECLLDCRPDLSIAVVPAAPSGLVVVRRLDPSSRVLAERMDDLVARYRDVEYPHEPGRGSPRCQVVGNDAQGLERALGGS